MIDVDVNEVLHEVLDGIEIPERVRVEVADDFPTIRYDPTQLAQVFQNLIANAIQHLRKPEGRITVGWRESRAERTHVFVRDTGHGIEQRHYDRIFRVFESLERREDSASTGVGLAIVRKIVTRHGGRIEVESVVGSGTTFSFTIPSRLPSDSTPSHPPAPSDHTP